MDVAHLITDFVLAAALFAGAAYVALEVHLRRRLRRRSVIVVLKADNRASWRGVLWRQTPRHLELRAASYLENDSAVPVDGSVILPRSNIAWIQDPEEA